MSSVAATEETFYRPVCIALYYVLRRANADSSDLDMTFGRTEIVQTVLAKSRTEDHTGRSCGRFICMWQALTRIYIAFNDVILAADIWPRADPRNKVVVSLSPQGFLIGLQCCFDHRTGH